MRFCGVDLRSVHPALSIEKEYPPGMPDRDVYTIAGTDGETVTAQLAQLKEDYAHVLRKIHYYEDIQESLRRNQPLPQWKDYKRRTYDE